MEIIKADKSHEAVVLELLDQFRTHCAQLISPENIAISTTAKEQGRHVFEKIIDADSSAIYLAVDNKKYLGIVTIHLIPQIRKGCFAGEIEEMFVLPEYQGTGIAKQLIDAVVDRAKMKGIDSIRLESSNELGRAHGFYKKYGFTEYGKAFYLKMEGIK